MVLKRDIKTFDSSRERRVLEGEGESDVFLSYCGVKFCQQHGEACDGGTHVMVADDDSGRLTHPRVHSN